MSQKEKKDRATFQNLLMVVSLISILRKSGLSKETVQKVIDDLYKEQKE
jgi:hypothetical protein